MANESQANFLICINFCLLPISLGFRQDPDCSSQKRDQGEFVALWWFRICFEAPLHIRWFLPADVIAGYDRPHLPFLSLIKARTGWRRAWRHWLKSCHSNSPRAFSAKWRREVEEDYSEKHLLLFPEKLEQRKRDGRECVESWSCIFSLLGRVCTAVIGANFSQSIQCIFKAFALIYCRWAYHGSLPVLVLLFWWLSPSKNSHEYDDARKKFKKRLKISLSL